MSTKGQKDQEEPIVWQADWKLETVQQAYDEAREVQSVIEKWPDTIDNKVVAIFSVASVIAGLAPKVHELPARCTTSWWLWVAAMFAWLVSASSCAAAFFPRDYRLDPDVRKVAVPEWYRHEPKEYLLYRLRDMKRSVAKNDRVIRGKALALKVAIIAAVVEVGLLAAALLLGY
jgi:hypothetical protein